MQAGPACRAARPDVHGISSETAASRGLCMHRLTITPGQYGRAHLHEAHESAIFVLEGEAVVARTDAGDQESVVLRPDLDELVAPPTP